MDWNMLLQLPRELQVHIFQYLLPSELVVFDALGTQSCLYNLSCEKSVVRRTDICRWTHVSPKKVKAYFQRRWKHIRELCLNDFLRVQSIDFFKHISFPQKFRELRSLHIVNCHVSLEQLQNILTELRYLENLSWSLMVIKTPENHNLSFGQVKKFYVESYLHGNMRHKQAMLYVLKWFNNLEYLGIHFSFTVHAVANSSSNDYVSAQFEKLHSLVCTSETFHMFHSVPFYDDTPLGTHTKGIVQTIIEQRGINKPWKRLWLLNSSQGVELYKLVEKKTRVIGMRDVSIKNVEPQPLMEMGGPCVQLVQLDTCHIESIVNSEEFLRDFFSLCCNITELNLFNTHVDPLAYPCRAIASLNRLKKLLLPVCCIFTCEYEIHLPNSSSAKRSRISRVKRPSNDVTVPLNDIVKGCPEISEIDIRQFSNDTLCSICRGSTKGKHPEDDLIPLHEMKNLSSLTLVGIQANRLPQGKFLEAFGNKKPSSSDFSEKLNTLRLYFVGPQGSHVYFKAMQSAFCNLKYLRNISLQHSSLSLESKSFWNAFSSVTGLERLCIASNFTDMLPIKSIETFIRQVPKLYVFHIHSRASNFKITKTRLNKFVDELKPVNEHYPSIEIVIQHLTMHIGLTTTERMRHEGRLVHIQELCAPGSTIAQTHQRCGLKSIL